MPEERRVFISKDTSVSIGVIFAIVGGIWYATDMRFQVQSMSREIARIGNILEGNTTRREFDRYMQHLTDLNPDLNIKLPPKTSER